MIFLLLDLHPHLPTPSSSSFGFFLFWTRPRKRAAGQADSDEDDVDEAAAKWTVALDAASKALAQRWLRMAQDRIVGTFKTKGTKLRGDVKDALRAMPPEDDWFFGAALRSEGQAVMDNGDQLGQDMRTVEAEETVKVSDADRDLS
jgi:hypothetical protein